MKEKQLKELIERYEAAVKRQRKVIEAAKGERKA